MTRCCWQFELQPARCLYQEVKLMSKIQLSWIRPALVSKCTSQSGIPQYTPWLLDTEMHKAKEIGHQNVYSMLSHQLEVLGWLLLSEWYCQNRLLPTVLHQWCPWFHCRVSLVQLPWPVTWLLADGAHFGCQGEDSIQLETRVVAVLSDTIKALQCFCQFQGADRAGVV